MRNGMMFVPLLIGVAVLTGCVDKPAEQTESNVAQEQEKKGDEMQKVENSRVLIKTSMGDITLELNAEKAPVTVENFLKYVDDGFYNGTIFHRVIKDFMVQGGGFTEDFRQKSTRGMIENEARNGLKNELGTVAMARTSDPNSATAQFFINTRDNEFLNFKLLPSKTDGYCVFGKVVEGMDVIKAIELVSTTVKNGMQDVPAETITIIEAKRL